METTYEIIGGDNRAHGPVTGEELCEWIRQGRAGRNTMIRPSNTETWRPLSTFPEFSGPLRGLPWIPLYQPAPKAHGLAVASLVLGIISLVIVGIGLLTGVPAAICGHAALRAIKAEPTEYGGGGMAIAGLITGYIGLLVSGVMFILMLLLWLEIID